ncbi:MAG: site-specific integrase [Bifidobacteriaceae bacterium]|jgi:integrase|nr:site-specific integrase [Bifidobacteriaceae bacterium]
MAHIQKRLRGGKARWVLRYTDPAGKERSKSFRRKVDANRYRQSVESAIATGSYVDPNRGKLATDVWAQTWLDGKTNLTPKSRQRYQEALDKHVKTRWKGVPLDRVTHADVQKWLAELGQGRAAGTVRKHANIMRQIMGLAVKDGRLVRNPAEGLDLPKPSKTRKRYLTHRQVQDLADAVGDQWSLIVRFLAYTGLRWGESAALRVGNLDLLHKRAIIERSVTPVKGVMVFGDTKGHRFREVPVPPFLAAELETLISQDKGPDDLLFTGPRGAVLRSQTFQRAALDKASKELSPAHRADPPEGCRCFRCHPLTPHELRHTAASLAIAAGADVKVVQQMLGHKSATMTLDLYGHLFPDRLSTVADAMAAARAVALGDV